MKVFCAVVLLASSLMAVATAYPTSSEGHMEKLLKTMIQEELEDRLQKEFAAQRMAEKENSEAEAEEENLLLKAEEAEIELDLEEAEEQAKAQVIDAEQQQENKTRSRLLKILLKLEEIVGVIRGVNPEAILKGFIHSLKARLPEGDRKETEPERIRDDENRIEDSLEDIHNRILEQLETIESSLEVLYDPEGIIRNFLQGLLGKHPV